MKLRFCGETEEETGVWGNVPREGNSALGLPVSLTCVTVTGDIFRGFLITQQTAYAIVMRKCRTHVCRSGVNEARGKISIARKARGETIGDFSLPGRGHNVALLTAEQQYF